MLPARGGGADSPANSPRRGPAEGASAAKPRQLFRVVNLPHISFNEIVVRFEHGGAGHSIRTVGRKSTFSRRPRHYKTPLARRSARRFAKKFRCEIPQRNFFRPRQTDFFLRRLGRWLRNHLDCFLRRLLRHDIAATHSVEHSYRPGIARLD